MAEDTVTRIMIRELDKFTMFKDVDGQQRPARLAWCVRDGNPRITVYTNQQVEDIRHGIVSAPMNPPTMLALLDNFASVIKGPDGVTNTVDCDTRNRKEDGTYSERYLLSKVNYGKDADGICWISIVEKNKPEIKFEFRVSDYHRFYINGELVPDSKSSTMVALATLKSLRQIYTNLVGYLRDTGRQRPQVNQPSQTATKPNESFDDDVF